MFGKGKFRSLDAICAKLKSAGENEVESGVKSTILTVNEIQNKTNSSENNNGDNKAILDNCVSCDLEKAEDGESEMQSSKTVEIQQVDNEKSPGSSRRKRKATTPRNISEVREKFDKIDESDELAEYEINNQNTDFPPEDDDDLNSSNNSAESGKENVYTRKTDSVCKELNDSVPQIKEIESIDTKTPDTPTSTCTDSPVTNSIHESLKTNDRKHARKPRKPVPSFNGCGSPLDLSTSSKETSYQNSITEEDPAVDDVDDDDVESEGEHDEKAKMNESEKAKCANIEISNLMDFAENTMNELLSIYGLNGVSDSVTRQVPNKCFSTNQILKGQVQGRVMPPGKPEGETPPIISLPSKDNTSPESVSLGAEKKGINTNYLTTTTKFKGQSSDGLKDDKFINSAAYIKAVFNKQPGDTTPTKSPGLPDYSKYLKRFSSGVECKVKYCKELGYREHFHCMDCNFRVFVKKEEMVRHFKWHRKREESLQHGFMRYSPMDDCSVKFGACTHNGRQTHYHCLQMGCDKVYISTSDVQMHANYHRKDSAIIQEGFQRFRATEDCGTQSCAFYGQRTTHFHCRRTGCNFTFKNKADMEKHKTYHQKDEVLARDGFKKFMKYEHCGYMGCRYSKLSNHIHCIRPGCLYVLHSTAQLFSHKRKHERRDFETAYRKYREESSEDSWMLSSASGLSLVNQMSLAPKPSHGSMSLPVSVKSESMQGDESCDSKLHSFDENSNSDVRSLDSENSASFHMDADTSCNGDSSINDTSLLSNHGNGIEGEKLNDSLTLPIPKYGGGTRKNKETDDATREETSNNTHDNIPITQTHSSALAHHLQSPTQPGLLNKPMATPSPAHTQSQPSNYFLSSPTQASFPLPARPPPVNLEKRERDESWKNYLLRFTANDPCNSRCQYLYKDHYHCRVDGCLVLFKSKDGVREHARFHEMQDRITPVAYSTYDKDTACPLNCQYSKKEKHYHCIWSGCTHVVPHHGPTFGRLEHYRIHEDARASIGKSYKYNMKASEDAPRRRGRPPKYPKNEIPVIPKVELSETEIEKSIEGTVDPSVINGFKKFAENEPCPDELCIFRMREHYHCARPRCHQATDRLDVLNLHAKDFHSFVTILEGFEFFDRNINCRRLHCHNNKANRHFHCVRPKCDYSFVRHSTMIQHNKRHEASTESENSVTAKNSEKELVKTEPATPPTQKLMPVIPPNLHSPSIDAKGMIKTSGIYFPLSGLTGQSKVQPPVVAALPGATSGIVSGLAAGTASTSVIPSSIATGLTTSQQGHIPIVSTPAGSPLTASPLLGTTLLNSTPPGIANPRQLPLTLLLQQGGNSFPQPSWIELCARMHYKQSDHCGRPFCKLKKKDHYHCFECNQAFSDEFRIRAHVGKHGLKFSKLDLSVPSLNLLYSPTASPHVPIAPKQIESPAAKDKEGPELSALSNMSEESNTDDDELNASDSLNLNPSTFSNMIAKAQKAHGAQGLEKEFDPDDSLDGKLVINDGENAMADSENSMDLGQDGMTEKETDLSKHSGRKRIRTKHFDYVDSNPVIKQRKVTTGAITTNPKSPKSKAGGFRGPRDDSIPDGYIKVRHKDQCTYPKCAYNQGVTHFHCTRSDCGYSFSDRSRLIQHTLRHERIDSLTGGEMQQFRMKQDCERDDCEYKGKASHFHCLKCNYCCTDSSKVLTHRKYHSKIENINSQGFEKYGTTEKCSVGGCQYEMKQTHYHCTKPGCHYAVLGPAQMASHNIKHANDTL